MDWQPIETAPKDGTEILVSNHEASPRVVAWEAWSEKFGWFIFAHPYANGGGSFYHPEPTHWMPLPEAPK